MAREHREQPRTRCNKVHERTSLLGMPELVCRALGQSFACCLHLAPQRARQPRLERPHLLVLRPRLLEQLFNPLRDAGREVSRARDCCCDEVGKVRRKVGESLEERFPKLGRHDGPIGVALASREEDAVYDDSFGCFAGVCERELAVFERAAAGRTSSSPQSDGAVLCTVPAVLQRALSR
eukprot:1950156-Rhodomonas_salina.3